MRIVATKLFAAVLLTMCVGVHGLEVSGRWDRTLHDANDEAGVVAVVLCIGAAVAFARTVSKAIRLMHIGTALIVASALVIAIPFIAPPRLQPSVASPPLSLRI